MEPRHSRSALASRRCAEQLGGQAIASSSFTTLDDPFATNGTFAYGINGAGQIVGYYFDSGGRHGFLETAGVYAPLDDPAATRHLGTV
jgi:hypothetical protein